MSGEPFPSTDISMNYVNSMIDSLGCPKEEYHFVDGSGLSFYNYVTPEIEVALLKYIYQLSDFFEEFKNALPISGIDGTLENRMRATAAEGKVFAKTGTLSGTNTLAGYAYSQNGHMLIFSIMNDGVTTGNSNAARKLQDEILDLLCK
jgi:D-alanyl-D-alanine carboxypeptidase/D-alanyl-D-alanine-endopeptidase (penicillin-binding protein 4)